MQNIVNFKREDNFKKRLNLREASQYLGMSYAQMRKIVVELNLIPYRNDGLGHYQKPSILVKDLDKYDKEKIVSAKKEL